MKDYIGSKERLKDLGIVYEPLVFWEKVLVWVCVISLISGSALIAAAFS